MEAQKASVAVTEGKVLGRVVGRNESRCEPERVQAIMEFAPLADPSQIRQFLGSTNWIRWFLPAWYPSAAKILADYLKPGKAKPKEGFGSEKGTTEGDKAVKAIELMAKNSIENSVMDEAAAIDGTRPLEVTADSCGYGCGATCLQLSLIHI